jgi:hypothetical protein
MSVDSIGVLDKKRLSEQISDFFNNNRKIYENRDHATHIWHTKKIIAFFDQILDSLLIRKNINRKSYSFPKTDEDMKHLEKNMKNDSNGAFLEEFCRRCREIYPAKWFQKINEISRMTHRFYQPDVQINKQTSETRPSNNPEDITTEINGVQTVIQLSQAVLLVQAIRYRIDNEDVYPYYEEAEKTLTKLVNYVETTPIIVPES